jgi:molecular chaperone DnaK
MKEFDEKLTEEDKRALGIDLEELKKAYADKNVDAIDESSKKLSESWHSISTKLYEQSQNEAEQTNESSDNNVEDVSFEEVSDEETK